jgi:hypothetical protein
MAMDEKTGGARGRRVAVRLVAAAALAAVIGLAGLTQASGIVVPTPIVVPLPVGPAESFEPQRLGPTGDLEAYPAVSPGRVAYTQHVNYAWHLYTWTPAGALDLTSVEAVDVWHQPYPRMSGDRIAWNSVATDGEDLEVYTWTPSSGIVRVTNDDVDNSVRDVSGDRLLFTTDGKALDTWTPTTGIVRIANRRLGGANELAPDAMALSGDRAAYCDRDLAGRVQVYTWTPGYVPHQVSKHGGVYPDVSGDRIVWQGVDWSDGSRDTEIYTWTPKGGVVQIERDDDEDGGATVSGDRVAWREEKYIQISSNVYAEPGDIYTWTPAGGKVAVHTDYADDLYPVISGDRIVWIGYDGTSGDGIFGNAGIYSWTPTAKRVTVRAPIANDVDTASLGVGGSRVVWVEKDGFTSCDVWTANALKPSRVSLLAPSTCAYGGPATLTGRLTRRDGSTFVAIASAPVRIYSRHPGSPWARFDVTTSATGNFEATGTPHITTEYRALYMGSDEFTAEESAICTVTPRVSLSTPSAPSTTTVGARFRCGVYLQPVHAVGTVPVVLRCSRYERQLNGMYKWVLRASIPAPVTGNTDTRSTCSATISLPSAARWKIEAYHAADEDNAATTSRACAVEVTAR